MKFKEAAETMDKDYRVFVYKRLDSGEMAEKKVGIEDAINLTQNDGWALSPAEFAECEELAEDPGFKTSCEEIARDRNMVENIHLIDEVDDIEKLLERMFGVKVRSDMKIENMRKRVIKEAKEKGII